MILEVAPNADYALLDSGDGEKLEHYGAYRIVRPEGAGDLATARCRELNGTGPTRCSPATRTRRAWAAGASREPLGETWPMTWDGIHFLGRFTCFRHVGVFPEQASHWAWLRDQIAAAKRPLKVLNLFGYTGVASLVAARAGAEVTHVDASKKAIGWARENQTIARLDDLPIRWICDDAVKFVEREGRRATATRIILFDPPNYGRGPKGEVWQCRGSACTTHLRRQI